MRAVLQKGFSICESGGLTLSGVLEKRFISFHPELKMRIMLQIEWLSGKIVNLKF